MPRKYRAYPEYKDSGVEWLGDIPKHWTVSKIKFIAPYQVGWTPPTKNDANFEGENLWANISDLREKVIHDTAKKISDEAAKAASMDITPIGSLLYSFKLSVGAVSFAGKDMYTNEAIASFLEGAELPLSYLYYVLPKFVIENASTNIYGARILNQELISNAMMLAPSSQEAEKIANFLDHETAKIDTLIEKQQQLIKLLKEKRQAVISHAVTKGLNPNAPMRDSGVDWLGEVPEHWCGLPLKLLVRTRKGVAFKSDDFCDNGIRVVKASDIKQLSVRTSDVFLPEKFVGAYPKAILASGDIILSTVGSNPDVINSAVGQIGMVPQELAGTLLNQNTVVYDPDEKNVIREYLFFVLQMRGYRDYLDLHAHGTANQSSLSIEDMLSFQVSLPPINEQVEICNYLNTQQEKLTALEQRAHESELLLKERRTALISAAVTGKIDVRNWQAPAPLLNNKEPNKEEAA
jgi:type I restriction enzyme S subunit